MTLTSRIGGRFIGRRLAAGIGLASAAILLPTTALATSAGGSSVQARDHAGARAVPACRAANTRIWYGLPSGVATGHAFFELQFSNIGRSACTFFGYPGVSALDRHGHEVGLPATHSGGRVGVTLQPRGTAHVLLVVVDAFLLCGHPVHATDLRVFPPGQFHSQTVPLATFGCPGKSVLQVDSIHPGAGIPGFSTR